MPDPAQSLQDWREEWFHSRRSECDTQTKSLSSRAKQSAKFTFSGILLNKTDEHIKLEVQKREVLEANTARLRLIGGMPDAECHFPSVEAATLCSAGLTMSSFAAAATAVAAAAAAAAKDPPELWQGLILQGSELMREDPAAPDKERLAVKRR
ncbi:hypothetical protein Efla_003560 [Eimeria flavescens]